ncbi:DUF4429 domain-containing protein [Streptomyces poriferorum]|uniref:DUF4429 domain-containing protein n=1 Tax=Streptomyces poriferorum TaxID=2798799 RepID=A0ABY9J3G0_9ACTN|nr:MULTISPECIES: DUF4429 domain-containing protein [unclassified Streptomyces]MDP5310380.1 DUF4429 domain-containing protein [Streptomyces sp. Alt4]WLQ60466.1 DUF4429 domain-containing protein [Streptomyces sp. Alt2]
MDTATDSMTFARRSISPWIVGDLRSCPTPFLDILNFAGIMTTYSSGGGMDVKGVQGSINFDGEWITITKRQAGQQKRQFRIRAADVTGTRLKPGTRLFLGYIQFVLPGSAPADESKGLLTSGRPRHSDPHSLTIRRGANDAAAKLMAAVEQARPTL